VRTRIVTMLGALLGTVCLATLATGCGALFLLGDSETGEIVFVRGELRTTEAISLAKLDLACGKAVEMMGYDGVETTSEKDKSRWEARTASGDAVNIRLASKAPKRTELRIRVGVIGDEARSRLVLEQIHQSL
jgi:hypothetical protein